MRWRYGYTWALFFGGCALLALFLQSEWLQRVIIFAVMTAPLTLWTLYRMRKQA